MTDIKPRKLTGRLQCEMLEKAAERVNDESINPVLRRWADSVLPEMSVFDLAFICDVDVENLQDLEPDALEKLAEQAVKENKLFFGMIRREAKLNEESRAMMEKYPAVMEKYLKDTLLKQNNSAKASQH